MSPYVNEGMPGTRDQWKCGCALVDRGVIFHGAQVEREEEWYLWSAKHCGTLWETTYIPLVRKHLNIYSGNPKAEAPHLASLHSPIFRIESSGKSTKATVLSGTSFRICWGLLCGSTTVTGVGGMQVMIWGIAPDNPLDAVCHNWIRCGRHFPCWWFSRQTLSPAEGQHSLGRDCGFFFFFFKATITWVAWTWCW